MSLIYPNTFISAPKEFPYRILSVRGWAKNSGIGVVSELKKKRWKESELTTGETKMISSGIISVAVAAVMELSSDELKQASEQGLELSAEEIHGLRSGFKCSIYDT